jgi:hypothetical protein
MNELVRVIAPTYDLSRGQIVSDNTHVGSRCQLQTKDARTSSLFAFEKRSPSTNDNFTRFNLETELQPRRLSRTRARTNARARVRAW